MSDAITKAYKAINGLNDLSYILDRKDDKNGKVSLKRFFFLDNSENAYRAVAGKDVKKIDDKKLDGEKKLARLRKFEQVWKKYGKACIANKDDQKVRAMIAKLTEFQKELGNIDDLKVINKITNNDIKAYETLKGAINFLSHEEEKEITKIDINKTITFYKKELAGREKLFEGFLNKMKENHLPLNAHDERAFISNLNTYEVLLGQYNDLLSNYDGFNESVMAKHKDLMERKREVLDKTRSERLSLKNIVENKSNFIKARAELSVLQENLKQKRKERDIFTPPAKYANMSIADLRGIAHRLKTALNSAELELDSTQRKEMQGSLVEVEKLLREERLDKIRELDKSIERLELSSKNKSAIKDRYETAYNESLVSKK